MTSIGERIRKLRGKESVTSFSNKIGVHRNTLPRYESGERKPDTDFIATLCREYQVSPTWLLLGEGPKELAPYQADAAIDNAKVLLDNDPEARKRQAGRIKDCGVLMRQSRQEAEALFTDIATALGLDESKAEYLRQTLNTTIFERTLAEQQRDQAYSQKPAAAPPIPDDNIGFGECADLLNKIFNSGNQVLIRAIAANLHAFSEAIDNKALAAHTVKLMEQMNERIIALEKRLKELEAVPKKAANG